jgi:hypothetical protein
MANPSKARGTAWETAVVRYLHEHGFPNARRKVLTGKLDEGDIDLGSCEVTIEAKNTQKITLSEFVDEARIEARNSGGGYGVAVVKRRGKGTGESYAVMRLEDWTEFVTRWTKVEAK